jgi:hypothetical protein
MVLSDSHTASAHKPLRIAREVEVEEEKEGEEEEEERCQDSSVMEREVGGWGGGGGGRWGGVGLGRQLPTQSGRRMVEVLSEESFSCESPRAAIR